ncbi:MAG: NYN domain-containing protein [Sphingomonadales bacterium]
MPATQVPHFYADERLALFIDGANLHAATRALRLDIDFRRLRGYFASRGRFVRALYYTAIIEDQDPSPLRPLIDWLDYNGFTIVSKPAKEFQDDQGQRRIKGNMDIELAIDMMEMADHLDHVVLFSGDGDFIRLVDAMKRKGVRVTVCSSAVTSPPMVADELRRQADSFMELADMREEFDRINDRDDAV